MRRAVAWAREHRVPHYAMLALILVVVALVTYHPHWNPLTGREYRYPVHMDEYVHWGYAQAIVEQGTVTFRNPFTGGGAGEFTVEEHLHERSYQAWLGVFQGVTGVDWLHLFQFGPALVAVFLALCVYVVCQRWDAGLEGALLVACIPTTLRFLGPGFMVPIVFSLPFVALGLYCLFHSDKVGGLVAFSLIAAALWPIHVIGAFGLFLLALLYAFFIARDEPRRAVTVGAMATLPFLGAWDFYDRLIETGVLVLPFLPAAEQYLLFFGVLPLAASVVGVGWLLYGKHGRRFAAGGTLGVGLVLVEAVILYRLLTGEDPFILYDRAFMLLYLLGAIAGGVGLAVLRRGVERALLRSRITRRWGVPSRAVHAGVLAAALLVGATAVAASVTPQLEQPYYEILTNERYEAYKQAGETVNATYGFAIVEGLPTMPFTILAGHPTVYVHFPSSPAADPPYLQDFFEGGANDTYLLVQEGATVVVTDRPVHNPDLVPVGDGVYVLRWDYASRIARGLASR